MDQVEEVRDGIRGIENALKGGKLSEAEVQVSLVVGNDYDHTDP
jgi:hypothetical protein